MTVGVFEWIRFGVELLAFMVLVVKVARWSGVQEQLLKNLAVTTSKLVRDFDEHEENDVRRFAELGRDIANVRVEALQASQARGKH